MTDNSSFGAVGQEPVMGTGRAAVPGGSADSAIGAETSALGRSAARRRRRNAPLGRTQVLVMHLLALNPKTVRQLSNDWPGLTEAMVSGALARLADRGYVDRRAPHGFYQWHLTDRGVAAEREMVREKALGGVDDEAWEEDDV